MVISATPAPRAVQNNPQHFYSLPGLIEVQTKSYSSKARVFYSRVTAGGEIPTEVWNFMVQKSHISPSQGNAHPHTSFLCISQSCYIVNQQLVLSCNFTQLLANLSVSPSAPARPESKLHSPICQGTQPTAAQSHHSHLYKAPISYAGHKHCPPAPRLHHQAPSIISSTTCFL